jgi:hypothetical protein
LKDITIDKPWDSNLTIYSEAFELDGGAQGVTVTDNVIIGPSGKLNGALFVEGTGTTGGNGHKLYRILSVVPNTPYTLQFKAKAKERTVCQCWSWGDDNSGNASTFFNLETGEITGVLVDSATMQSLGDGWWLCTRTVIQNGTASTWYYGIGPSDGTDTQVYDGDGVSGCYFTEEKTEVGSVATPYVMTTDTAMPTPDNTSTYSIHTQGELPLADFIAAANVCDEDIGDGVPRYLVNGTVNSDQDKQRVLTNLAQCMAGIIVANTWNISAGKFSSPIMFLDQSDVVGSLSVVAGTADSELVNGYKGQFISNTDYVLTDYKPYQNTVYSEADEREMWGSMDFPFTDDLQHVHNILRILTEDHRYGFTIVGAFSLKTQSLKIGDRVVFSSDVFYLTNKILRITNKTFSPSQAVELTMKEDDAGIWDLADDVVADAGSIGDLPNPWAVTLCGNLQVAESLYQTTGSAGVKSKATASWDAPPDATVKSYDLQYKKYAEGDWINIGNITATSIDLFDLAPDVYDFRVRAVNVLGVVGQYTAFKTVTLYGLTAPPADMTGFNCVAMAGMCVATWDLTIDLDVRIGGRVQIRRSALTAGASFGDGVVVQELNGDAVSAILPLATGTYMAKFIDSTGHFSPDAASFVVTEALVTGWASTDTFAQDPTFSGTKTDCETSSGYLIFSSTGDPLTATYEYDSTIDMGSVAVRRYHSLMQVSAYVPSDLLSARGLISTWPSIDYSTSTIDDCNAWQEISVSDDASTWSDWVSFDVADFSCRYAKVRLQMTREDSGHNLQIQHLSTVVKTPT